MNKKTLTQIYIPKITQESLACWSQSLDLNVIENLVRILKVQVHQRDPLNLEELKINQKEWAKTAMLQKANYLVKSNT